MHHAKFTIGLPACLLSISLNAVAGTLTGTKDKALPIPNRGTHLSEYAKQLSKAGIPTEVKTDKFGDEGYGGEEHSILLPTGDFELAYRIAQKILEIPESIQLPKNSKKAEETIDIPQDKAWVHEVLIKRDESGLIKELRYYARGEGGGTTGILTRAEPKHIKLSIVYISD